MACGGAGTFYFFRVFTFSQRTRTARRAASLRSVGESDFARRFPPWRPHSRKIAIGSSSGRGFAVLGSVSV
jgi:hypothetical protein